MRKVISLFLCLTFLFNNAYGQPSQSEEEVSVRPLLTVELEARLRPITFQIGSLTVTGEFLDKDYPAPYRGYILSRSDVGLLKTVVDSVPEDFTRHCDQRIDACIAELQTCQADCNTRVETIMQELTSTKELLVLETEKHGDTRFWYTIYGFGGAVAASLTTALIVRIIN